METNKRNRPSNLGDIKSRTIAMELKEAVHQTGKKNMDRITDAVCAYLDIPKARILSKSRERHLVDARRMIYNMIRSTYGYSLNSIGIHFKKNHATIIHGIRTHKHLCKYDSHYKKYYSEALGFVLSGWQSDETNIVLLQKKYYFESMLKSVNTQIQTENEKTKHKKNGQEATL